MADTDSPVSEDNKEAEYDRAEEAASRRGKPSTAKKFDLEERFIALSGYEKKDINGSHDGRRTVVTTNGGKYQLGPSGKKLRVLAGPDTPKMIEEATEEEDDE